MFAANSAIVQQLSLACLRFVFVQIQPVPTTVDGSSEYDLAINTDRPVIRVRRSCPSVKTQSYMIGCVGEFRELQIEWKRRFCQNCTLESGLSTRIGCLRRLTSRADCVYNMVHKVGITAYTQLFLHRVKVRLAII